MLIGVWNTAFLGDAVLTLPLIQTLKRNFPQAKIHYYVRAGFKELFTCHPDISAVYEFNKKGFNPLFSLSYARALASKKYSIWISAHTSQRSTMVSHFCGAPIRIGYNRGPLSRLVYTHTVSRSFNSLEEIERLLQLARPMGISEEDTWPRLTLPQAAINKANDLWQDISGPVLGIHPGSVWATKRWPAEYFAKVAKEAAKNKVQIMLFSGKGEEKEAQIVREESALNDGELIDLSGVLSLPELAACLGKLDCYLTNDSGPMHLAWAQKTPTTAIFGPTTKALGFFPRGEHSSVMQVKLRCRPCGLHGHKKCPQKHHKCMRDVSPEVVWQDIKTKLKI